MSHFCYVDPSHVDCVGFQIPQENITNSLNALCSSMDWMPGLSLYSTLLYSTLLYSTLLYSTLV
jgi:hypothetical protein